MLDQTIFGEWLRKRRRASDLTRQALADQAGCAEITLRRIENGTLKPSKELAQILLDKLGIPKLERPQWILFARGLSGFPTQTLDAFASQPLTNLPASLTTFIGREKEQAEIIKLIRKHRLVTLTGPGGVGKTRLSIKTGEQLLGDYANGVWLVELASLNDPELLPTKLIALFDMATQTKALPTDMLINFLRTKTILLIFDNCEHLLEACAQLTDRLLKNCPNLKILATSRESLVITGEAAYPVPSLGLPDLEQLLENFRKYESVHLFEERAQLAKLDFSLTLENAPSITQICRQLDGIPLAIELAAAHINMFSTDQIAARLNESFNLLTGGSRTALPHQQTIRASIDWSWNLLSNAERLLMQQLSVFVGGWTLESACAVCDGDVSDLISSLVKKSLIAQDQAFSESDRHPHLAQVQVRESGRERRYHFHEVVRQFAREKLVEADEVEKIRNQHLKYFLELAELAEPALHGPQQMDWFRRINDEIGNIRVALEQASRTDLATGLYLSGRLIHYWVNIDLREGLSWTTKFVQKPESNSYPHGRAKALLARGRFLWYLQQFDEAYSIAEECISLFRATHDRRGEIDGLMLKGIVIQNLEGMGQKIEIHTQALALAKSIDDTWRQAKALSALGWDQRDLQKSRANWHEAIALFRQAGDWRNLALTLGILGYTVLSNGEIDAAQVFLDESMEINQRMNYRREMEFLLTAKSHLALIRGEYKEARACLQEWMVLAEEMGNRMGHLWARARLGFVTLREGNTAESRQILSETVENFYKDRNKSGLAFVLDKIASLYVVTNKPEYAAHLIGWSDMTRKEIGDPRPRLEQTEVDRDIATVRTQIGNAVLKETYNKGCVMSLDEAVGYATEEIRL